MVRRLHCCLVEERTPTPSPTSSSTTTTTAAASTTNAKAPEKLFEVGQMLVDNNPLNSRFFDFLQFSAEKENPVADDDDDDVGVGDDDVVTVSGPVGQVKEPSQSKTIEVVSNGWLSCFSKKNLRSEFKPTT